MGVILFDSHAAPPLVSPSLYRRPHPAPDGPAIAYFRDDLAVPLVPYIIGGDTRLPAGAILETGTNNILCDFKADLAGFMDRVADPAVLIRANLDPRFLRAAPTEAIMEPARRSPDGRAPSVPASCWGRASCPSIFRLRRSWPSAGPWSSGSPVRG